MRLFNVLLPLAVSSWIYHSPPAFAQNESGLLTLPLRELLALEAVTTTALRREQDLQQVAVSVSVINQALIRHARINDITDLPPHVPGLQIAFSGSEARPALRGARTNEVGVAGTGIAEQIVGIYLDGVYVPTTTMGLGHYADVERIEVLRGPQGTLYGRNTFAGSINVITNPPQFDRLRGDLEVLTGAYDRSAYSAVLNLPLSPQLATRAVLVQDRHNGYITNRNSPGPADDLRERNELHARSTTQWQPDKQFAATLRVDYARKNGNGDAIWGYQQIAGYQIRETQPGSAEFAPVATVTPGNINQPPDALHSDRGPRDVYRNALHLDEQEVLSTSLELLWKLDHSTIKWINNYTNMDGRQFYDADYSDGGPPVVGGFGREDDQFTASGELQWASAPQERLDWVAGLYFYRQEADWAWLWREDTSGDGNPDSIVVPGWGNPGHDPHKVDSRAVYGQLTLALTDPLRLVVGGRYNRDEKQFSGESIPDWNDHAFLWKVNAEFDMTRDVMLYAGAATGYRTGGANDARVVQRGADPLYDNEEVLSFEIGAKTVLLDHRLRLNASAFVADYDDVKAQLFAVACLEQHTGQSVIQCAASGDATTFEYYENGGGVDARGLEIEWQWLPSAKLLLGGHFSWLEAEFDDNFRVGNSQTQPLLGLGNLENRQDINDPASQFSFGGWEPAFAPAFSLGLSGTYRIELGHHGELKPYVQLHYTDNHYAFDTNIPEVEVDAHTIVDAGLTWEISEAVEVNAFVKNLGDKTVLKRAVVHSQIIDGLPANLVQANWNDPRTWSVRIRYHF